MSLAGRKLARSVLLALLCGLLPACSTWQCDWLSCPDGCCDEEGTCLVGGTDSACGFGGNACENCYATPNRTCFEGACVPTCSVQNCADGCCDEQGRCRELADQYFGQCGRSGATCVDCRTGGTGRDCQQGACCGAAAATCATTDDCCQGLTCKSPADGGLLECSP